MPGTVSGYYVARVRVIDQSGNAVEPADPNAQVNFVVDTHAAHGQVTSPANNSVLDRDSGPLTFTV